MTECMEEGRRGGRMWESDRGMVVGWGGVGRRTHGVAQTVFSSEYRLNYLIGKLRELLTQ